MPYRVSLMSGNQKMSRLAYAEYQIALRSNHKKANAQLKSKWNRDINYFRVGSMRDLCSATKSTYLQTFHFRLIARIMPTNYFLHKIGKSESSQCTFCCSSVETLIHLFWECDHTKLFVAEIKRLMIKFKITQNVSKERWFFPDLNKCSQAEILLTTIAKLSIYRAQLKKTNVTFNYFANMLRFEVEKERNAAVVYGTLDKFKTKWGELESVISLSNQEILSRISSIQ